MLQLRKVTKIYGEGDTKVTALKDVSLQVSPGDFIAIMGPSGSGKSTLLNIIGGLERLSSGEVILEGNRIDNLDENALVNIRREKIAYVFQQYHLIPSLTALENVLLPLVFRGGNGEREKARDILRKVGLANRTEHKPSQLSGGEQQRVAIARALVGNPALVLADEPTGNMDRKTGEEVLGLFDQLHKEGHTIITVTHNPEIAEHAGAIIALRDGQIVDRLNPREGRRDV